MIRCIIIDDEKKHREYLKELIAQNFSDVEFTGEAKGVIEGIQLINQTEFDILFLDVQMNPLTGFDVLKSVTKRNFEIIFTTSYDEFALEAIKFSALDYLLKPYGIDDLKTAIDKFRNKANQNLNVPKINNLLQHINPENPRKKIGLSDKNGIEFYEIADINYCKSDNVYTTFFLPNKKEIVTSKPIKEYEMDLEPYFFYRVHNSYLVNLKKVKKYIRGDGGQVEMEDGSTLDVARNKKEGLLQKLKEI